MAGSTAVAGLATFLRQRWFAGSTPAVDPGWPGTRTAPPAQSPPGSRTGTCASGETPGAARAVDVPVILAGALRPPGPDGRHSTLPRRHPDVYCLLDEHALAQVQRGESIRVRSRAERIETMDARVWWRRTLHWMVRHQTLSLALAGLDPYGPGLRASVAVEPRTGVVSRRGTRARIAVLDLELVVNRPGQIDEDAARRAAARIAEKAIGARADCAVGPAGTRWRVLLGNLHRALRRLGVHPGRYKGLKLSERLLATACQAIGEAFDPAPASSDRPGPGLRPWPALAGDMARLQRGRLSVVSPFAFLPPDGHDARAWLDLLPAIRLVDAVGWRRPRGLPGCGWRELEALYRLTWAARRGAVG